MFSEMEACTLKTAYVVLFMDIVLVSDNTLYSSSYTVTVFGK